MDSIGADALGAMWSETTLPCHTAGILLLFSDLLHQLLVGGALDDLVELGAVVPHEAHAADHDVARAPAVAAVDHPKVHGNRSLAGADLRLHGGLVAANAVDGVADDDDLLAVVEIELAGEHALDEVTEEPDELLTLGRRARLPVTPKAAARELLEVEHVAGETSDRRAPLLCVRGPLELGVVQNLHHPVDAREELLGRLAGPRRRCQHRPEPEGRDGDHAPPRSEEHTSELQSPCNLVCRLLLEKKKSKIEKKRGWND